MLKQGIRESFPHFQFPRCYVLIVPNVERSKRTTSHVGRVIFSLQQKKQELKQKKYNLMIESLLSNFFMFTMESTCKKVCGLQFGKMQR